MRHRFRLKLTGPVVDQNLDQPRRRVLLNLQRLPVNPSTFERKLDMGLNIVQYEVYTQVPEILRGISPVKTEPEVLRSLSELISMQVLTQQLLTQLATNKAIGGQAFIGGAQRANEAGAFDDAAGQVRLLSQKVQDLERRLDEATGKKAAAAATK